MLELYTHPQSPCAQKVKIMLAEKGLAWTKHHVNLPEKENLRPEYLTLNPLGVVPTLVHNGRCRWRKDLPEDDPGHGESAGDEPLGGG